MAADQPVGVVPGGEIQQRQAQFLDGREVAHPQEVFLECPDEALGDAVALGLAHEGRRGLDAEEGDLALEVVGHIVRSVVVPEHEAGGHVLADGAEVPAHTLADRFQGLEAVGALVGVDADAFAVAVIDGDEDVRHALGQGDALGHIGAPQDVHGLGGDGAVVRLVRSLADPVRCQQVVLPHQPPHSSGRAADAGKAQTGPDLAVALAGETALGDRLLDGLQQGRVVARSHGAGPAFGHNRCLPVAIHGRPRNIPAAGDPRQAIDAIYGGRDRLAHGLDLRRAKGAPALRRAIFSRNSSVSMVISPTFPFSRTISSSRSSRSRSFSAASAASNARSRHCDSRAAVTLSSRATSSSGSPRSSRLTARSFRFAEKRCPGGPPADLSPPASWGRSAKPASSVPFSSIPSIRLSYVCGPFNRSRLSPPTLTHPTCGDKEFPPNLRGRLPSRARSANERAAAVLPTRWAVNSSSAENWKSDSSERAAPEAFTERARSAGGGRYLCRDDATAIQPAPLERANPVDSTCNIGRPKHPTPSRDGRCSNPGESSGPDSDI